jgi:hypothetical protein
MLLLLGSLAVLGSCALPWLSGETVDKSGLPARVFAVHVWSSIAVCGVPLILLSVALFLSAGLRSLSSRPADLDRGVGMGVALGGIVGTVIFFFLLAVSATSLGFNAWSALASERTTLNPAPGGAVCLAGYVLTPAYYAAKVASCSGNGPLAVSPSTGATSGRRSTN